MATYKVNVAGDYLCEIEASVTTGFELTAKKEVEEKFKVSVKTSRGNIAFKIPYESVEKIYNLHSIDNVYVVLNRLKDFEFSNDVEKSLLQIENLVSVLNWKVGLSVWGRFFSFSHPISDIPNDLLVSTENGEKLASDSNNKASDADIFKEPSEKLIKKDTTEDESQYQPAIKNKYVPCERIENVADLLIMPEVIENAEIEERKSKIPFNPLLPKFRATCYRTGQNHPFTSMQVAACFGGAINDYFHWNVDMKNFDIEVVLKVIDNEISAMIPLTRGSLHKRNMTNLGPTTLRATIAYNMLRLCDIKIGDVLCDPMCGSGGIPIEAAVCWPTVVHIAGEIHEIGAEKALKNKCDLNAKRSLIGKSPISLDVYRWDVTELPLKDESVDIFITDLPFGKRHGSKRDNRVLYPKALREMARTCRRGSGRACFLTQDTKNFLRSLSTVGHLWRRASIFAINMGGLNATVSLLRRTKALYTAEKVGDS